MLLDRLGLEHGHHGVDGTGKCVALSEVLIRHDVPVGQDEGGGPLVAAKLDVAPALEFTLHANHLAHLLAVAVRRPSLVLRPDLGVELSLRGFVHGASAALAAAVGAVDLQELSLDGAEGTYELVARGVAITRTAHLLPRSHRRAHLLRLLRELVANFPSLFERVEGVLGGFTRVGHRGVRCVVMRLQPVHPAARPLVP